MIKANIFKILSLTVAMSLSLPLLSYAGQWKQNTVGWWYENDDGTYPINQWKWIDSNNDGMAECYYFNENGYLLTNTQIPGLYNINENGEWILRGGSTPDIVILRKVEEVDKINAGITKIYRLVGEREMNNTLEAEILEDGTLRVTDYHSNMGLTEKTNIPKTGDNEWTYNESTTAGLVDGTVFYFTWKYSFEDNYNTMKIVTSNSLGSGGINIYVAQ